MNFQVIVSGVLGTLAMTLFIELICVLLKKPFHVIRILAFMLPFGKPVSSKANQFVYLAAVIVHYAIGIFFSWCFAQSVKHNLLTHTLTDAIFFGALAGLIGIIGWRIFFAIHPNPPKLNLYQYLLTIWLGHIIFSIGLFYSGLDFFTPAD